MPIPVLRARSWTIPARAALVAAVGLAVSACSAGAGVPTPVAPVPGVFAPAASAPTGVVAGVATTPAPATQAPRAPAATTPADAPSPSTGAPEGQLTADPALEARIPTLVRGIEIDVISLSGAEFIERAPESELGSMIAAAGLRPAQVSVAIGVGRDDAGEIAVAAFHFPGAAETALLAVFVDQLEQDSGAALQNETVGSHDVLAVDTTSFVPTYLQVLDDVAIVVQANDPALAASTVEALPLP